MNTNEIKNMEIDFNFLIDYVKSSNFFVDLELDQRCQKLKNIILKDIDLNHINLPQRLRHHVIKNNITSLDELLDIEPQPILRNRNLGRKSIIKAQRIILSYLYENEECLGRICKKINSEDVICSDYIIEKYFPLLQGIYKTSEFYFHNINKEISCIKIPARISNYIVKHPGIRILSDILNVSYNELRRIDKIGDRTIKCLQYTLIELLRLEKVTSVPASKK